MISISGSSVVIIKKLTGVGSLLASIMLTSAMLQMSKPITQSTYTAVTDIKLDQQDKRIANIEKDLAVITTDIQTMKEQHSFMQGVVVSFGSLISILLGIQTFVYRKEKVVGG